MRVKAEKYTIRQFNEQFPDEATVLAHIFQTRYNGNLRCEKCGLKNQFHPVAGRRSYACNCGFHVYPTAGTAFHKSPTPLKTWFYAIFLMHTSRNGVAALELQRQIGVTYKCAWRMTLQIRGMMSEEPAYMTGTVEADETGVGGKRKGKRGRGAAGKTAIVAALERGGNVLPVVAENTTAQTVESVIELATDKSAKIMTDGVWRVQWPNKVGLSA